MSRSTAIRCWGSKKDGDGRIDQGSSVGTGAEVLYE